jgi:tRNA uridine 5-carboxymethylaminomethyl modification enzyme
MGIGYELGLIDGNLLKDVTERKQQIAGEIERVKGVVIKPTAAANDFLKDSGTESIRSGIYLDQLLKRAELDYHAVEALSPCPDDISRDVSQQVEIEIKYEGYIDRQLREIDKFKDLEVIKIPDPFDFRTVHGLSNELKEKLAAIKPTSLGQVSRVEGITPAAISVLMIALKTK